jgi:hypothetical protein
VLTPKLWQQAVLDYLEADDSEKFRKVYSPRSFNLDFGVRINMGRRQGHSTLAQMILERYPNSVLVLPTETAPYYHKQKYPKELHDRIWVCSPQEAVGKFEIMSRAFEPLKSASILVIDNASFLSEWELETLRAASWLKYVELQ